MQIFSFLYLILEVKNSLKFSLNLSQNLLILGKILRSIFSKHLYYIGKIRKQERCCLDILLCCITLVRLYSMPQSKRNCRANCLLHSRKEFSESFQAKFLHICLNFINMTREISPFFIRFYRMCHWPKNKSKVTSTKAPEYNLSR